MIQYEKSRRRWRNAENRLVRCQRFRRSQKKLKVLKRAELLASGWEVNKIKAIKILKENIIEILYVLGILCISTAGFLTDIKMGFFVFRNYAGSSCNAGIKKRSLEKYGNTF